MDWMTLAIMAGMMASFWIGILVGVGAVLFAQGCARE